MDSKRKADRGASSETGDRSVKRRKMADFDLTKGESRESTTAYGLSFLDQIRRTADKSGRLVATYFEKLVPRQSNAEYYKRTRLPISLEIVEQKLDKGEFKNLAELESYFKRMIANAKEFYPRSSTTFDDAERVRKALSNYMTKTNPAYSNRQYQALPTPLPPEGQEDVKEEDEAVDEDADGEEETQNGQGNEDAEGAEEDADGDDAEQEDDEEPESRRKSIILKRRGPERSSRNSVSYVQQSPRVSISARPDHQYENVPYKGLSFQQAQEKVVEELIRHQEPEYDDAYFEPFVNLPPRALKDYYRVITDPLSLKKLQKITKGVQGRNDATGVSEFKTWANFEEKSKLLWTNAYFYNEEGSEIYSLAQDLEKEFRREVKQAKTAVPEPSQPKIKLKVGQGVETPGSSKKITIHVGGRGESADSPAPQAAATPAAAPPTNGVTRASAGPLDAVRSGSAAAVSPSPSAQAVQKTDSSAQPSPAVVAGTPGAMPGVARPPIPAIASQPQQGNPMVNGSAEKRRLRAKGKGIDDALLSGLRLQAHPTIGLEDPLLLTVLPNPKEAQQSATVHLPPTCTRIFIVPRLPDFLHNRQYSLWAVLNRQPLKPFTQAIPDQVPQDRAFEVLLHGGVNVIEVHLVAAIPRSERVEGGPEVELEIFTVFANVLRN